MTFTINTPVVKKPSKRIILVIAASVLVLSLLVTSLAAYQQTAQNRAHAAAVAREQAITSENEAKAAEQAQVDKINKLTSQRDQACNYLQTLATQRNTRTLVTVPVVACTK